MVFGENTKHKECSSRVLLYACVDIFPSRVILVSHFCRLAWRCSLFCSNWQQFKCFQLVRVAWTFEKSPSCSLGRHLPEQTAFCEIWVTDYYLLIYSFLLYAFLMLGAPLIPISPDVFVSADKYLHCWTIFVPKAMAESSQVCTDEGNQYHGRHAHLRRLSQCRCLGQ